MNLQQLQAACAVVASGFNISAAAAGLNRAQPTLSRQIQSLEAELGTRIFVRTRNKVVGLTPKGEEILRISRRMVLDADNVLSIADADGQTASIELRIATTHLHARFSLPAVMKRFARRFEGVALTLRQGDPVQCCELVASGAADIGVTTVGKNASEDLVIIPAYRLSRCVIAPRGHPLTRVSTLTLKKLAEYPMVAYSAPFSGRWIVDDAFARAGLRPRIVCSAIDADVSKTYVDLGMGIAVLARIAFDPARDRKLVAMDAAHLFQPSVVNLVLRKHGYLTRHIREFVSLYVPHLDQEILKKAIEGAEIDCARLMRETPVAVYPN